MQGLQTRGVNVRPHKRSSESRAPNGLRISSAYDLTGHPGRPLPGYRSSDFGLRTGRKRKRGQRHVRMSKPNRSPQEQLAALRIERKGMLKDAAARKAQGLDYRNVANAARGLKARMDRLEGKVYAANADVDTGSASWQTDNA